MELQGERYAPVQAYKILAQVYNHPGYRLLKKKYRDECEKNTDNLSIYQKKQLRKFQLKLWCHLYLNDNLPPI